MNSKYLVFLLLTCAVIASDTSLLNEKVITYMDISSQLVKVKHKIYLVNELPESTTSYFYTVDPLWKHKLSYIEANDEEGNPLYVNKIVTDDLSVRFEILFHSVLSPGKTETLHINAVFTNCLQSHPKSVKQNEEHLVLFTFNVYYYSLYFTEVQTLVLYAGSTDVTTIDGEEYKLANKSSNGLQYGPYLDQELEAIYISSIHYRIQSPFLTVDNLIRFIHISHWGYISVLDKVSLIHTGPNFIGPFERPHRNSKPDTRIESFVTSLPEYAFDVYLKDEIGVISSFNINYDNPQSVDVQIRPRFVLYGGWKTEFEIGFKIPIQYYVTYNNDNHNLFSLFIPLVNKLFPDMFIKEASLNVVLPEGATYQDINPYYELENVTNNRYCNFMDVICRETVSFRINNLVDHHSKTNFQLTYSFLQVLLLLKPVTVTGFIFSIYLLFVTYFHMTSSNYRPTKQRGQSTLRNSEAMAKSTLNKQEASMNTKEAPVVKEGRQKKTQLKSRVKTKKR